MAALLLALAMLVLAVGAQSALGAPPTPPFNQCPAVGSDQSCAILIVVTDAGSTVYADPTQGPYDGADDTLVGVQNASSSPIGSLPLSSTSKPIFGFEGDGICTFTLPGCPFGPTGYEGPHTSFTGISSDTMSGTVSFNPPIPPGGSAYFSLEDTLTAVDVTPGPPSPSPGGGPVVSGLSPSSGPAAGATTVSITGSGFTGATAVNFGATPATSFTVVDATHITATAPPGTGVVDVTVTTPAGTSATGPTDQYTYIPPPTVTGLSPATGPSGGGTSVTITGTGFTGVTAVEFGSTPAVAFTVDSPTQITATAPPGTGAVDVTVVAAGGTSATSSADLFTYRPPPPIVTGVAPASGTTAGGNGVVIFGSNLQGATAVRFGSRPGTIIGVNSNGTALTVLPPPGTGTVDVTVTTPSGTSPTTPADRYTYVTPAPGGTTGGGTTGGGTTGGTTGGGTTGGGTTGGGTTGGGTTGGGTTGGGAAPTTGPPTVIPPATATTAARVLSSTGVELTATINPRGLPTTMHFEYSRAGATTARTAAITYDARTPEQPVGGDFANHTVTARVAALLPNSTYHFRSVAKNPAGLTSGPDLTFRTATDPPPPPPVLGKSVNALPVSGVVYVLLPGKGHVAQAHARVSAAKGVGFVPLTEARQLPVGTIFDTSAGVARLTSATATRGRVQSGQFGGGVFRALQNRRERGLTELALVPPRSAGVTCGKAGRKAAQTAAKRALPATVLTLLRSNVKGKFRTRGRYSAATVRGTVWTTSDRCDGTLTSVTRGSVVVSDFRRQRQIVVRAGHSYLARAT